MCFIYGIGFCFSKEYFEVILGYMIEPSGFGMGGQGWPGTLSKENLQTFP